MPEIIRRPARPSPDAHAATSTNQKSAISNQQSPAPRLSLAELNALGFVINIANEIGILPLENILRQAGFRSDPITQQLTEKRGPCTECGAHTHVILASPARWLCLICRLNNILGPENEPTLPEPPSPRPPNQQSTIRNQQCQTGQAEPKPAHCPSPGRAGSARPTLSGGAPCSSTAS